LANLIRVIGIGPGNPEYITPAALKLIDGADILIGGERILACFKDSGKQFYIIRNNLSEMADFIKKHRSDSVIAVLASGDPAFYGILEHLKRHFAEEELDVIPGISSVQLACARLCLSWHDAVFYSVHGRTMEGLIEMVRTRRKVVVLTDPGKTPAVIARELIGAGLDDRKLWVCENLSYEDERVAEYRLNNVPGEAGLSGCVVVITDE